MEEWIWEEISTTLSRITLTQDEIGNWIQTNRPKIETTGE